MVVLHIWRRLGVCYGLGLWLVAANTGCGLNMQAYYQGMRPQLVHRDFAKADTYVQKHKDSFYKKDNALLYAMDRGMVLHLQGQYQKSNVCFEQAKDIAQALWTESIGKNAEAWLTTDNALPYQGEDFEKVMIHLFEMFNYFELGQIDEAGVEARQMSQRLAMYANKLNSDKQTYRDDGFARWMSAILWENAPERVGALSEAWIDYRQALHLYETVYPKYYRNPMPRLLVQDALRVLQQLGADFSDERQALQKRYPGVRVLPAEQTVNKARIILLHENGEAPFKTDAFWTVPVGFNVLRIAYPVFISKNNRIVAARIHMHQPENENPGFWLQTTVAENIEAIAIQNLSDHMSRIEGRATARAVAKFTAGAATEIAGAVQGGGAGALMEAVGWAWNTGNAITEEADKRSWLLLPKNIGIAEAFVEEGLWLLDIDFIDLDGRVIEKAQVRRQFIAGQTNFLSMRTFL